MPILKIQNHKNFTAIPNETLRDKRLSIEARGILAFLLTHSNTFEISFEFLQNELSIGRDKLKNTIRELKVNGYLSITPKHNHKGNFNGQEWFVFAESQSQNFLETPYRVTENPSDGKPVRRENRQTENPSDNIKIKSSQNKNIEKQESLSLPKRKLSVDEAVEILESEVEIEENSSPTRAIEIFREVFPLHYLDGRNLEDFAIRLPEIEESVWRQNLLDWRLSGWQPGNISGIIKRYERELKEWLKVKQKGEKQNAGSDSNNGKTKHGSQTDQQRNSRSGSERWNNRKGI